MGNFERVEIRKYRRFYRSTIRVLTRLYFLYGVPLESVNDILDLDVIRSFHRFFAVRTDAVNVFAYRCRFH